MPWQGLGLEIGVGTGRFAVPLGVKVGVDPSMAMLAYAAERGVLGIQGIAEDLPFKNAIFNFALVVTTICFVGDARRMLVEARRVLKPGAPLVIGFVDRDSALGQYYLDHKAENVIIDATGNLRTFRNLARQLIPEFAEIYVKCPLER